MWQVVKNVNGEDLPDNSDKCLIWGEPGKKIGLVGIFLIRVKKSSTAPFLELSDGGAQIYIKNYNIWINMETEKLQPVPGPIESDPMPTWYIVGWGPNYKYPNQSVAYGFYDIIILNTYGLGDIVKSIENVYVLTSSVSHLQSAYVFESLDGINFSPESGEPIQGFDVPDVLEDDA